MAPNLGEKGQASLPIWQCLAWAKGDNLAVPDLGKWGNESKGDTAVGCDREKKGRGGFRQQKGRGSVEEMVESGGREEERGKRRKKRDRKK